MQGFGSLESAWQAPSPLLAQVGQWSDRRLVAVEAHRRAWGADPLPRAARLWKAGRGVLLPGDRHWPQTMHQTQPPPVALYWSGRGSLWPHLKDRRAVAVVGTRRPSRHGLQVSRHIGAVLARGGWPVVSGLAAGIDGAAHAGCLEHQGRPVGVLGTPLERVYPRHHAPLQTAVGQQGLLLSELPPGAAVSKGSFAQRNRLQVALACAVVLVECPQGSGALHSAELAWSEGLPLWVVPADTGRSSAEGSNGLLARGAAPLTRPEDLLKFLGQGPIRRVSPAQEVPACRGADAPESAESDRLLAALGSGASIEDLCAAMNAPSQEVLPLLLDLEASGVLLAEPGLYWRRCCPVSAQP
ncbi:MAG: DNA-processing protein DprA [Cyanobacteriota bacterium]|nr:DNA-processing protein DprA [Cyanobacteriota bacterium]